MAGKRKTNGKSSAPLSPKKRPKYSRPVHTRANPAYDRHQSIANNGAPQDAGGVVHNAGAVAHAPPRLEQVMRSSWSVTTSILQNLRLRDYYNCRLSCRILASLLPLHVQGQPMPATINLLARCQNLRTYPRPLYLRYPDTAPIPFPPPNPLGPGDPCPHNNPGTAVLLHICAGYQLGLRSAVGPNGHGSDYWVCEECVSDTFHAYDFTDWLPHRIVKTCVPCATTLRANNQGELSNSSCQ